MSLMDFWRNGTLAQDPPKQIGDEREIVEASQLVGDSQTHLSKHIMVSGRLMDLR